MTRKKSPAAPAKTTIRRPRPEEKSAPSLSRPKPSRPATERRFRLTIEYDGTQYSGWQIQADAKSIQGSLAKAAATLFPEHKVEIQGCGRTDAGVHALHYVAHLSAATELAPQAIQYGLNDALPKDIVILAVERAGQDFHARHSCVGRSYLYRIAKRKSAFEKKYVWWVRDRLNVGAMERATRLMVGMHDFAAFAEKQELKKSTKVLLHQVALAEEGDFLLIRVVGSHFLWKMVRRMVGILVEVGRGRLTEEDVRQMLTGKSELPARHTAPPSGLFFERAFYSEKELQEFLAETSGEDEAG
ncbi:MAG: tRNA pseudouridine(38-40) synthase TruA [Thermodesulfobacteriota bacterium]